MTHNAKEDSMSEGIKIRATLTLDAETVGLAVREFLERAGHKVESVTMNVTTTTRGYGMGEYDSTEFTGATVSVDFANAPCGAA